MPLVLTVAPAPSQAAEELHKMILADGLRFACLLVYANKIDLPHSLSAEEVTQELRLDQITDRKWHVQPSCATTGEGLYAGLKWLASAAGKCKFKIHFINALHAFLSGWLILRVLRVS